MMSASTRAKRCVVQAEVGLVMLARLHSKQHASHSFRR